MMAVGDAIAFVLSQERNFSAEDFARFTRPEVWAVNSQRLIRT